MFRPNYDLVVRASKLYDTLKELDFGARWRTNAQQLKKHIGIEPSGSGGRGKRNNPDDDEALRKRFEILRRQQEAFQDQPF